MANDAEIYHGPPRRVDKAGRGTHPENLRDCHFGDILDGGVELCD